MMFLLSLIIPVVIGITALNILLKETKILAPRFLFNLSIPIGVGLTSFIFIFLNLVGFPHSLTVIIQLVIPLLLLMKYYTKSDKNIGYIKEDFNINKLLLNPILLLATILYFYSWLMNVGIFYFESIQNPHGLWDAWSCWNLIAKFISRAPADWPQLLHQMNSVDFHPDYPLLQRGFIANCWLLLDNETVWIPIISAFIFTFCTIGLLSSAVALFNNKTDGIIAGLVLLCTPFFMVMGYSQYADNTVGFFYLATVVLITLARREGDSQPGLFIAAGITTGLAAWSKNEGLLFIICLAISQLARLRFQERTKLLGELKYLFWGMLPFLLLITYQKNFIAPPNQILSAQGSETFEKLTDFSRYEIVSDWFFKQFGIFGKWLINPWWLFLIGLLVRGFNFKDNNHSFVSNMILLLLMLSGFFFVEIVTPHGLVYYLSTSVHRLFFQLFPTFIFIYFLSINGRKNSYRIVNLFSKRESTI